MSRSPLFYVFIITSVAVIHFQGLALFESRTIVSIVLNLWFFPGRFAALLLRRLVRKQPLLFGITFQVIFLVSLLLHSLLVSTNKNTELEKHRSFFSNYMLATMFAIAIGGDIPFWVNAWIVAPSSFIARLTFHSIVGYWDTSILIYGLFLVISQVYLATWLEGFRFEQFQAYRQLDRQRQTLEATQETLQCMLSSVWDASCTCKSDGSISSSTPHLELLLGGGRVLVGSCLPSFAANEADASRLQDFLRSSSLSTVRQAFSLQCTLRPDRLDSGQDMNARAPLTCEATLYGIRLPPGPAFGTSRTVQDPGDIFIGVKASWSDANIPEASDTAPSSASTSANARSKARAQRQSDPGEPDVHALAEC